MKTWKEEEGARMENRQKLQRKDSLRQVGLEELGRTRRTRIPESTDVLGAEEDLEGGREGEDGK